MAFSNMGEYAQSINFYLNALSLNPNAEHIWDYIKSSSLHMRSKEFMELSKAQNFQAFRLHFNVLDPSNLPKPSLEKLFTHPLVLSKSL